MLSVAGGALGLALAYAAIRILVASDLPKLPRIHDISIDPTVVAFTLAISLLQFAASNSFLRATSLPSAVA